MAPAIWLLVSVLGAAPTVVTAPPDDDPSVYEVHPLVDGAVVGLGAASVGLANTFSASLIHPRCPCDPAEVNAIDRTVIGNHNLIADRASDGTVVLTWIAPVLVDALDVGADRVLFEDMLVYAEALAVNGALVTLAKYVVQRPLPVVYAGQDPAIEYTPGGYRSFYSGHTSNAVTALMVMSMTWTLRHGTTLWPWVVTAATGIMVGTERVLAGRHFYSDVAVGALSGIIVGWAVPELHRRAKVSVSVVPLKEGAALSLQRTF